MRDRQVTLTSGLRLTNAYHRTGVAVLLLAVVSLTVFLLGRRPGRQEPLLMLPLLVQLLVFAWFWVGAVTP